MAHELTQRELRNASGKIVRALDAGESFVITRKGVPVGELTPLRRRAFVAKPVVLAAFAHAPSIDRHRFRADVDAALGQDPARRT
jgi:antitoxin (DNA-binding transcriptional repressor) of toxin-antitoxin stability system